MISFEKEVYLIFLVLIPCLIAVHFFGVRHKRKSAFMFSNFEAIAKIKGVEMISRNIFVLILASLIVLLLTLSLDVTKLIVEKEASSFSFVIAIDSSKSMEAQDIYPSRLDVAKETASDFVNSLPVGTKIGIISFSGSSFLEIGLNEDKIAINDAIDKIPLSSIGGTDIFDAISNAGNILQGETSKSLLILSDGQINIGSLEQAIKFANERNIVVNTIGLGTNEGGTTSFGISKIDEDSLKSIAFNTQGRYYKVETKEELQDAFLQISEYKYGLVEIDISDYCLIASIALFFVLFFLINTRYKGLP